MRFRTARHLIRFNWLTGLLALMSPPPRHPPPMFLRSANRPLQAPSDPCSSFFSLLPPQLRITHREQADRHRPCSSTPRRWLCRERLITWLHAASEDISAPDAAASEAMAEEAAAAEEGEEGSGGEQA